MIRGVPSIRFSFTVIVTARNPHPHLHSPRGTRCDTGELTHTFVGQFHFRLKHDTLEEFLGEKTSFTLFAGWKHLTD